MVWIIFGNGGMEGSVMVVGEIDSVGLIVLCQQNVVDLVVVGLEVLLVVGVVDVLCDVGFVVFGLGVEGV